MKKFFLYCFCLIGFLKFIEKGIETSSYQTPNTINEYGLVEMSVGNPKAPKTITVYYSLACFYSRRFLNETYPEIKKKYIDNGKLRMIFREFYFPRGTEWTAKLSRIGNSDIYFKFIDYALKNKVVENSAKPTTSIIELVMPFFSKEGFSKDDVVKTMTSTALMDKITKCANEESKKHGIQGAPTFVSGKQKHVGFGDISFIDKFMETGKLE